MSIVIGFSRFGAYRTHVVVRDALLEKLPSGWTFAEGAALLVERLPDKIRNGEFGEGIDPSAS